MSSGGFSSQGLRRLHDALTVHVDRGDMPGLIALVAREGVTHIETIGMRGFGDHTPMTRHSIIRIASLSKPIVAAAAMAMADEGAIRLDDPVDIWLPELADRQVLRTLDGSLDDTVPAARPIMVEDLLTFRMGFGVIMNPGDPYPIQLAEEALQLKTLGPPWPPTPHRPDEWMRHFAGLPLMYQPGARWMYNTSATVLGVLLERAAGQPLQHVLEERIFAPLGMHDTGFSVPVEHLDRLTTAYAPDPETGELHLLDGVESSYWGQPPLFPDAAGWLVSTIDDYWSFVQMMKGGGAVDGQRVLSESTAALMVTNRLTARQRRDAALFLGLQGGWGLGLRVPAGDPRDQGIPGGFGWDGGTGTVWRTDRARDLTGILFTQRAMTSPAPPEVVLDFWAGAYDAIDD